MRHPFGEGRAGAIARARPPARLSLFLPRVTRRLNSGVQRVDYSPGMVQPTKTKDNTAPRGASAKLAHVESSAGGPCGSRPKGGEEPPAVRHRW
jgi:hypothetical protein